MRLITYGIYAPFTLGVFATLHIQRSWFILLYEPEYRCCLMFSVALFLHNHWKFACQYLKTALLFKHVFVKNMTMKALEEIKKQKFKMRLIEHSVSIFVCALYIYFLIIAFPSDYRTIRGSNSN